MKELNINDGYIGFFTYEISDQIAVVYLSNNITIKLGYNPILGCLNLIVFLDGDINRVQEELQIYDLHKVKYIFQDLINKYNGS